MIFTHGQKDAGNPAKTIFSIYRDATTPDIVIKVENDKRKM